MEANVEPSNPDANGQDTLLNSNPRPTISGPINNLNSAWDDEASSSSESIYNEAIDDYAEPYTRNPFEGWSSFRPVGPPPPPPPESIPMVSKPVAKKDQSTMTVEADCPKPQRASKGTRSGIQSGSGYMASPETSMERVAVALPKHRGNSLNRSQASYEGPNYDLPALPQRSSSLRRKKRAGRRKNASNAATLT